jgi:hypothetical protein
MPLQIEDGTNAKYVLVYSKNIDSPPHQEFDGTASFRTFSGLLWFFIRNRVARTAIVANRYKLIKLNATAPSAVTPPPFEEPKKNTYRGVLN